MGNFYKDQDSQNIFLELMTLAEQNKAPQLEKLNANTTDAAQEKHVPVITVNGNKVEVAVGIYRDEERRPIPQTFPGRRAESCLYDRGRG